MKTPRKRNNYYYETSPQDYLRIYRSVLGSVLIGCAGVAQAQAIAQNRTQAPSDTYTLPAIQVTGNVDAAVQALNPETTVGSKEALPQREIPQTISVVNQQ